MASMLRGAEYDTPLNFEDEWAKIHGIVLALITQERVTQLEWQDLFLAVYKIHSWVEDGKKKLHSAIDYNVKEYVRMARERINCHIERGDQALLRAYIHEWTKFYQQTAILPLPFMAIDPETAPPAPLPPGSETRTPKQYRSKTVREEMLETWKKVVFQHISLKLLSAALRLVEAERNGDAVDARLVIGVRESWVALYDQRDCYYEDVLEQYRKHFEREFVEETVAYYKKRAAQYLAENGVINYMSYADRMLDEEEQRAKKYLNPNPESVSRLVESCVQVLVVEFEDQILAECPSLIAKNDVEKLRMMYRLIKRTPSGIEVVLKAVDNHIRSEGLDDMKENAMTITTDPEKYISQLLSMFDRFSTLVKEGFYDDARLLTARDKAFRALVNDTTIFRMELPLGKKSRNTAVESKCPELLANYCDLLLRKTQLSKKLTSEEIDAKLNNLLLVLKYIANKDVFMRFHKAHLSRRLILDMSADQEKEEAMVNKLRECGMPAEHVNKLFRMLQDIEVNKDLNSSFKKSLVGTNNNRTLSDLINIKILNGGAWGRGGVGAERVRVSLPRELEEFVPEVEAFYKKHHNGRKLNWMHHWSSGTIIFGTSSGGRYDLEVTTFQMAVLFCWNDRAQEKISFESLRLATELPDTELARTLFSLVAYPKMKSQILLCDAPYPINPRDFTDSTLFFINHDFTFVKNGKEQHRGRINLIGRLQLSMESSATKEHEDIVALREFRVQEAAVKIMKMRKTITSAQLQTELVEMLKPMFIPNRKLIKEQIDWLIENRFIERKIDDINTFVYVS
ncbi:cullin family protein [Ancylostoma caninum]|uniref:Cullin-5 n=1 Tax=Ancylostoma caninum TaxID=29170 RepID=A0A368GY08_ANCCA|nr:cullin family protein [Ancylostoma caninum]